MTSLARKKLHGEAVVVLAVFVCWLFVQLDAALS